MPVEVDPVLLAIVVVDDFVGGHALALHGSGDGDRSFRTGHGGLGDVVLLIRRNVFVDDRRVTVDLAELECRRSPHGTERVALAALGVDLHLHDVSFPPRRSGYFRSAIVLPTSARVSGLP
jgi:hypothetical protein